MKEIKAIIQPFKLNDVLSALHKIPNLPAMTVADVRSVDAAHGALAQITKTRLEIMVPDELVEPVVKAIETHAHTGNPGDGRVFVINIEDAILIRSGEHDRLHPTPLNGQTEGQK